MRPIFAFAAAGLLALTISAAQAQQMAAPSTPIPVPKKPNFAPMAFYVGTWNCSAKSSRRATPQTSTETYTMDETGYWLIGKQTTNATSWLKWASNGTDWITWDSDSKRWVDVYTDDHGQYDLAYTKGWVNGVAVWKDLAFAPGPNMQSMTDFTVKKVSSSKITFSYGYTTKKSRAVTVSGSCSKSS